MSDRRELYRSPSGDTWWLGREHQDGRAFIIHEPNAPSGGHASRIELGTFLASGANGPEHQALLRLIGTLVGTSPSADERSGFEPAPSLASSVPTTNQIHTSTPGQEGMSNSADDDHLVRQLGSAVVACWSRLPVEVQDMLLEHSTRAGGEAPADVPETGLKAFIASHLRRSEDTGV